MLRASWIENCLARIQRRIVEWDRKRIEDDLLAKAEWEEMRAILQDRAAQTWLVQRSLSD